MMDCLKDPVEADECKAVRNAYVSQEGATQDLFLSMELTSQ
jgi:hypothetical protein